MPSDGKRRIRSVEQLLAQRRDARLIKLSLAGDTAAFAKLVAANQRRVQALGMSFFKNESDIDDFVQDVFIKVYMNLAHFKGDAAFSTWLTRIAYNTAINTVNRRREYVPLADETLLSDPDFTPEEQHIRDVTVATVREAVATLPEKYGICLEMYFFYDLSYDEIGVITGFPLNTIKSHIFRAKKLLRDKLRGFYEE